MSSQNRAFGGPIGGKPGCLKRGSKLDPDQRDKCGMSLE
jgi:hypothetical protein